MIEIDGSLGEGGGQILRTALSLSAILGVPFRIKNIRVKRKRPGLMPQHLAGVKSAGELTNAEIKGGFLGSTELEFSPKGLNLATRTQELIWDVAGERGSAGAVTLVIQTVLPIMFFSSQPMRAKIRGGTHVPFSPIYEYLERVLLPFLRTIGFQVESQIRAYGYYPIGGGEVVITTQPVRREQIKGVELLDPGSLKELRVVSAVSLLSESIAWRQANRLKERLGKEPDKIEVKTADGRSPGTYLFLLAQYEKVSAGFSGLGEKGKPAEKVADEVYEKFRAHNQTKMALDPNLSDQVLIFFALSRNPFTFTTSRVTEHLKTNIQIITTFLPNYKIELIERENGTGEIKGWLG